MREIELYNLMTFWLYYFSDDSPGLPREIFVKMNFVFGRNKRTKIKITLIQDVFLLLLE